MVKFTSKVVRQLNLLIYLLKSARSVSFSQIKENMGDYANEKDETSRKLFERDKKDLREMGIPIIYDKLEDSYTIERTRFYIQKMPLSEEEKCLLRVMINLLLNTKEFPIFQNELVSSLQKLAASGYYSTENSKTCPSYIITRQVKKYEIEIDSILYDISAAIFDKKRLLFEYPSITDDKLSSRHVDPLGMMFRDGTPYLIGYCHMRRSTRIFNIFRIENLKKVEISPEEISFIVPKDFKIEKYSDREIWEFENEPSYIAVIRFSSDIAWLIENQFHAKVPIEKQKNGEILFKPIVSNTEGIISFILSFGDKAVVEEPQKLRLHIRNEICNILYEYDRLL